MRLLIIIAAITLLIALFAVYKLNEPVLVTVEEVYRDDEAKQIQRSIDTFLKIVENNKTHYVARGAHAKGHACVKAYFDVNNDIPSELQHGVFQFPGQRYKAWIRFSNAASRVQGNHDNNKDARGMAIKLIDIYRHGLTQEDDLPDYQDFLMHDSPVFFAANMQHYNEFTESKNKILYFVSDINPFNWRLRELMHALATLKSPPASPLWNRYFSNTAYKLGPHNIKFSTESCSAPTTTIEQNTDDKDFLRKTLAKEIATTEGCFYFKVQLQQPDKNMPIENPSVLWNESDSPFVTVARITIPAQEFDRIEQQQFCEDLAFSPWNTLPEHRPIGELNRIRKAVYRASSTYRQEQNARQVPTNLNW